MYIYIYIYNQAVWPRSLQAGFLYLTCGICLDMLTCVIRDHVVLRHLLIVGPVPAKKYIYIYILFVDGCIAMFKTDLIMGILQFEHLLYHAIIGLKA